MTKKLRITGKELPQRWYRGADVPMAVIRRFARQVAERFEPDKIILFGSYAYGTPHADSDVDILVVMPARNQFDQAFKIRLAIPAPFPMDLIVRTPRNMKWRLEEGESFLTQVVTRGKVLYEKDDRRVGAEGGRRPRRRPAKQSKQDALA
jgi:predicted nucleotidyltransferase